MKIASSLKSLKKRDLNSKLVRTKGEEFTLSIKKIQNLKQDKNKLKWITKVIRIPGIISRNLCYGDL